MPLHLAHHKSYHPYNRENIERVQRDEAIAALEEAQAHSSAFSTRDQARLDLLRRQALTQARGASDKESKSRLKAAEREVLQGKKGALERFDEKQRSKRGLEQPSPASHSAGVDSTGHINFWADQAPRSEHQRPGQQDTNKQQQQQRKQREPELPFTLSRPAKELQPWYTDAQLQNGQDRKKSEEQKLEDAYKDSTIKSSNDPLKAMEFFLAKRKDALKQKAASTPQPRSIRGFDDDFNEEYSNMFDPDAVRAARARRGDRGYDSGCGPPEHIKPRHKHRARQSDRHEGDERSRRSESKTDDRPHHHHRRHKHRSRSRSPESDRHRRRSRHRDTDSRDSRRDHQIRHRDSKGRA